MMRVEAKLLELGLVLPAALRVPEGFRVTWRQVRVVGNRAIIAGHGPRRADGTLLGPSGKVGRDLTVDEGYAAARSTALAILGDLKRELGDLDRVTAWLRVFGMVNSAPGFTAQPQVIDGFTDLMIALYGEDVAVCPRAVAGVAELALNSPVIIEGEVEIRAL
jgi:YjgF/chorismate_mutase-like, putative endoribonuclease